MVWLTPVLGIVMMCVECVEGAPKKVGQKAGTNQQTRQEKSTKKHRLRQARYVLSNSRQSSGQMNDRTCTSVPGGRVSRLSAGRRGAHRLRFAFSKADFMSLRTERFSSKNRSRGRFMAA